MAVSCKSENEIEDQQASGVMIGDTTDWPPDFGFGRLATSKDIERLDIDVRPDGVGLPEGSGNVLHGRSVYAQKCAVCHGKSGTEGPFNQLVSGLSDSLTLDEKRPTARTIGNYWPYATTVYDYINRSMPYDAPGSLTADEVYSLTAFLLHANNIIDSATIMNAGTLPTVVMPAKKLFVLDDRKGGHEIK